MLNKLESVSIDRCLHFRGFRYGGFSNNPYEDYILGLHIASSGEGKGKKIRSNFIDAVLNSRVTSFSSALNISLEREYAPWIYPWAIRAAFNISSGVLMPQSNPDIISHYSPGGVLASHINREFLWLEQAYDAVSKSGYLPKKFGYITLQPLKMGNEFRYIVLDGNHRLASLHALGISEVEAIVKPIKLCSLSRIKLWPGVVSGRFTLSDAERIFLRYFEVKNREIESNLRQELVYDESLLVDP